jgi:hypothetical protein
LLIERVAVQIGRSWPADPGFADLGFDRRQPSEKANLLVAFPDRTDGVLKLLHPGLKVGQLTAQRAVFALHSNGRGGSKLSDGVTDTSDHDEAEHAGNPGYRTDATLRHGNGPWRIASVRHDHDCPAAFRH